MAAAWGGCSLCSFPSRHHALKGACQGLWSCVGLRKSPLGLYLCLQIFITLWGPIVSGSGNGGGGPAVEFPETDSLKGKGIFSYLSPRELSPRGGASCIPEPGRGTWELSQLRRALAHSIFLGEFAQLSVTILVSLSQRIVSSAAVLQVLVL